MGQVYFSQAVGGKNGVAKLFHKSILVTNAVTLSDGEGRWVSMEALIGTSKITLLNIYAPTAPDPDYWKKIKESVSSFNTPLVLIGGDCNEPLSPDLD